MRLGGGGVNHFHNCAEFDLSSTIVPRSYERVCAQQEMQKRKGKEAGLNLIKVNVIVHSWMLSCIST